MDLMIRNWMIIIGFCLIMVVLLDALRRVFKDRREEVRLNAKISRRDVEDLDGDDSFNLLTELPNGGARIVSRDDLQPVSEGQDDDVATKSSEDSELSSSDSLSQPFAVVDTEASAGLSLEQAPDAKPEQSPGKAQTPESELLSESEPTPATELVPEPELPSFSATDDEEVMVTSPAEHPGDRTPQEEPPAVETMDWLEGLEVPEAEPEPEARLPRALDPHVFVLNVMSRSEVGFAGSDILGVLLACDLRFGDMDFFHRHEHRAGRGPIQFSVCNMLKPGVFNIDDMGSLHTRGLMFFITLPGPEDMLKAFDYMHETAKAVAKNLDGYLLDETRSGVTRQSIEHMRQQIRELERRVALQNRR